MLLLCLVLLTFSSLTSLHAQNPPETVGRIEGEDVAVKGQVSLVRENNRSATVLVSGSEVTVRSGSARILLAEGGEIGICGPAQFSLLKSSGSLTLALNSGRVHARLENDVPLTVFTPLFIATPLAIGNGPRQAVVGLEAAGAICVFAVRGAVRLEHQLTSQTLLVPENGEVALPGDQLESIRDAPGACRCESFSARVEPPKLPGPSAPLAADSANASKEAQKKNEPQAPAADQPIWKVLMPPLTFDAARHNPSPPPSPETLLLVAEVRVLPAVVFNGRVEPRSASEQASAATLKRTGLGGKIKGLFRWLFGAKHSKA